MKPLATLLMAPASILSGSRASVAPRTPAEPASLSSLDGTVQGPGPEIRSCGSSAWKDSGSAFIRDRTGTSPAPCRSTGSASTATTGGDGDAPGRPGRCGSS